MMRYDLVLQRLPPGVRQGETKRAPMSHPSGLNPETAAVHFNDPFDQGQTNPGAVTCGVQAFKEAKDLLLIPRLDPNAIVLDETDSLLAVIPHPNDDLRRLLLPQEFDG